MKSKLLLYFLLFTFIINVSGQENKYNFNSPAGHKHYWESSWIMHPTASVYDYGVFHFRNMLELDKVPDKFIVHVSADPRYRLYVNGVSVAFGPARGTIWFWRYETLDIAKYLKKGANVIAAEVFNFGKDILHAQQSVNTAFIFQVEDEEFNYLNTGSGKWKTIQNHAYKPLPYSYVPGGLYAVGPGDKVDASLYPWGWETLKYDDQNWLVPYKSEVGHGRGVLFGNPWLLVKRSIPLLEQTKQRIPKAVVGYEQEAVSSLLAGESSLIIPANSEITLLLDQTFLTIGYPELYLSNGLGSKIEIRYAESLFSIDSSDSKNIRYSKGNRNEVEGKIFIGNLDIFLPAGGENRLFRPLWIRTYRYIQMKITTGKEPLVIEDYFNVFTAYPFEQTASFESNRSVLSDIYEIGWRTQRLCAGETFFDCPYFEQLNYSGDTRIQALTTYTMTLDDRLAKDAIKQLDESRMPMGLTQARAPGRRPLIIPGYSLYYVSMIYDYMHFRNDFEWAKQFLKGIRYNLEWFENELDDETGLLKALEWWNYVDWTEEWYAGIPDEADNGYSSIINIHYLYTLHQAVEIFQYYGEEEEAMKWQNVADKLAPAIIRQFYNEDRSMFADTPDQTIYSQHANIFAILAGLTPVGEENDLMNRILTDKSLIQSSYYFRYYLFEALRTSGLGHLFIDLLEPWENMMSMGLTTFAEKPDPTRSDCHAWSASPLYFYMTLICGIEPSDFGFNEVSIEPDLGELKFVKGVMPHPKGEIKVYFRRKGKNGIQGSIVLPAGVKGEFLWNEKVIELTEGKQDINVR